MWWVHPNAARAPGRGRRAAQVALLAERVGAGAGAAGMGDWDEAVEYRRRGSRHCVQAARERVILYDAAAHVVLYNARLIAVHARQPPTFSRLG